MTRRSNGERIPRLPAGLTSLCPLHQELDSAYQCLEQMFERVTVAQVVHKTGRATPLCDMTSGAILSHPEKEA